MRGKNMTIKTLIEQLSKFDDNQRVWIAKESDASGTQRVTQVYAGNVTMSDDVIIR